ncbi:MAG TPA: hypothetical protein DCZ80_04595 [Legionellales bacterium]|nr:hypothetical protein [Legionellales bacterium]
MKKIISIVAVFALLVSFADLAIAKKHRHRHQPRGLVSDTVKVSDDAVRGTSKVAGNVLTDTGNAVGNVFR